MAGRSGARAAPLNALRSFEAAARHRSFVAAATELGVTASAISVQIKRLEARLGRPLFERGHRSVELTPVGERLAPALGALFLELDRLLTEVVDPVADAIQISAMPSFATRWLAPRLAGFAGRRPSYPVRLVGEDALVDFDRDGVDIGLRYGPGDYGPLHVERIAAAEAFPVCSPGFLAKHADRLSDPAGLAGVPLLIDETSLRSPDLPSWPNWFAAAGVGQAPARPGPQFDSLHMALAAAVGGQGVALGLTPLVDADLASGALVRLFDTALPSPYAFWFVCRRDRLREPKIRAFRDWILDEARG